MGVNGNANASEVLLQDGSSASTSVQWITPLKEILLRAFDWTESEVQSDVIKIIDPCWRK